MPKVLEEKLDNGDLRNRGTQKHLPTLQNLESVAHAQSRLDGAPRPLPALTLTSLSISVMRPLALRGISVETPAEYKLKKQRVQRPHMTKHTDVTKIV